MMSTKDSNLVICREKQARSLKAQQVLSKRREDTVS